MYLPILNELFLSNRTETSFSACKKKCIWKQNMLFLLRSKLTFLHVADAPGVVLADYNHLWREQRRFGLMTLRNFGLGKQLMERSILAEIQRVMKILEQSVGMSTLRTQMCLNIDIK